MTQVLVLRHNDIVPPGYLADALEAAGAAAHEVRWYEGDRPPSLDGYDGVVSLGGVMGAYDVALHPWLADEKALLAEAVDRDIPTLGICLGCQLLADALGGSAFEAPEPEIRFGPVRLTGAGAGDPVVRELSGPVLSWHHDTWTAPSGSEILATSDRYPQAFRLGSAVGIQPHPEASPEMVARWASLPAGRADLEVEGLSAEAIIEPMHAAQPTLASQAHRLFGAWLDEVRGFARRRAQVS